MAIIESVVEDRKVGNQADPYSSSCIKHNGVRHGIEYGNRGPLE